MFPGTSERMIDPCEEPDHNKHYVVDFQHADTLDAKQVTKLVNLLH